MEGVRQTVLAGLADLVNISKAVANPEHPEITILEAEHHIAFGVYEGEIIVFFFDDHEHFSAEWDEDYIQSAVDALRNIFTCPLLEQETRKGKKVVRREWFFLREEGRRESIAGPWILGGLLTNPFARKTITQTFWRYSQEAGRFLRLPEDASEAAQIDWDILVSVRKSGSAYSFDLERYFFDEEACNYFWMPVPAQEQSFYATQEEAMAAGKEAARQYCRDNPKRNLFAKP